MEFGGVRFRSITRTRASRHGVRPESRTRDGASARLQGAEAKCLLGIRANRAWVLRPFKAGAWSSGRLVGFDSQESRSTNQRPPSVNRCGGHIPLTEPRSARKQAVWLLGLHCGASGGRFWFVGGLLRLAHLLVAQPQPSLVLRVTCLGRGWKDSLAEGGHP